MKRSVVGMWCFGIAGALLVTYGGAMTTRTEDAANFVLIPYPWVWWLLAALVVFAVLGAILVDWPFWSKKAGSTPSTASTSSPQAAVRSPSPAIGPTYNTIVNGPANLAQGSTGVEQTNTSAEAAPAPGRPASGGLKFAVPWTEHEGLQSHRNMKTNVRTVRWASNNALVGELRPAARGGGWDVYDVDGIHLGGVADEKAGMVVLKNHES
ncbi:hypothetical protein [Curtobacterium sp. MCBD17_030]|uniref:hypothetical protein n=1 Tax=Curtobacterium sp. MCBD17_030 TaxID=2175649 RepID=UPI000DA130E4|nr:hypothetical protein [Curtobacterium sp. MCBD17_030]